MAFLYLVAIGAYTSLIGLVKYARMYGLYWDIAAELGNCQERYELQREIAAPRIRLPRGEP